MFNSTSFKHLLTTFFCFITINCLSQQKPNVIDHYIDEEGHEVEIVAGVVEQKQESDNQSQSPDYKDGWFFQAFKMIQSITNALNGFHLSSDSKTIHKDYDVAVNEQYVTDKTKNFWSFGIGLGVTQKGVKYKFAAGTFKTSIYYLEVPEVKLRYNMRMQNRSTLFFDLTPYFAIALGGNSKTPTGTTALKFGSDAGNNYKRTDGGFKIGAGYRWKAQPLFINLFYDLGLANIYPATGVKYHNRGFGVGLGCKI